MFNVVISGFEVIVGFIFSLCKIIGIIVFDIVLIINVKNNEEVIINFSSVFFCYKMEIIVISIE